MNNTFDLLNELDRFYNIQQEHIHCLGEAVIISPEVEREIVGDYTGYEIGGPTDYNGQPLIGDEKC